MRTAFVDHLRRTTAVPVHPAIVEIADSLRQKHPGACAIIAYGSTLRDSSPHESLIDLYVLTQSWRDVATNPLARWGCRLVPPNVYYAECTVEPETYRAKYAVLPLAQFTKKLSVETGNPYFWARFCQPARIVWTHDDAAGLAVLEALQTATATSYRHAKGLAPKGDFKAQWIALFQNTYRTELRPESAERARLIVDADIQHYDLASGLLSAEPAVLHNWKRKRWHGKSLSVLRLVKAAFTFQGGADYIAWKIKRHSGVEIKLSNFQRRHPLIAAVMLLPALLRKGAVR